MTNSDVVVPPPERIQADVTYLKEWMAKEPHLPSIEDEEWLTTFLYNNKFSLEKTKYKLDNYYSFRAKHPEYFTNRDPFGADIKQVRQAVLDCYGHKPTRDGMRVLFCKFRGEPADFDPVAYYKKMFMLWDLLLLDPANRLANFLCLADSSTTKPMHFVKILPVMSSVAEAVEKGYSFRTKGTHIVNFPSFGKAFLEATMKLFSKKAQNRIQFHSELSSLLQFVDEDVLTSDFGGKGPSLEELNDLTQKKLEEKKDWFKEQEGVCTNEALRPKDSNKPEEMRGSFRKMEVD